MRLNFSLWKQQQLHQEEEQQLGGEWDSEYFDMKMKLQLILHKFNSIMEQNNKYLNQFESYYLFISSNWSDDRY